MLELRDLHKRYGDIAALDGCSFTVERGQLLGFLGPNGAGKTTAMRSVFSLLRPDAGSVSWDRADITASTRLGFGYMPEQRGLYPRMKIADQLAYFGKLHGMDAPAARTAANSWLERLGLGDRSTDRLEDLSHGNQQRVQLAAALVHSPTLLVLDEPFSGLDPIGVESMTEVLAEQARAGVAVMFSSHQLDLVEDLCEDVVIIDAGKIVLDGSVSEIRSASPVRYLDVEMADAAPGWAKALGAAEPPGNGDRIRLQVDRDADLGDLVERASALGTITQFTFEPPNLSEVFLRAVGR